LNFFLIYCRNFIRNGISQYHYVIDKYCLSPLMFQGKYAIFPTNLMLFRFCIFPVCKQIWWFVECDLVACEIICCYFDASIDILTHKKKIIFFCPWNAFAYFYNVYKLLCRFHVSIELNDNIFFTRYNLRSILIINV
jgi:hypothetical protein